MTDELLKQADEFVNYEVTADTDLSISPMEDAKQLIKTLSNELRQLESEYDALLNKLGDKCCACSVDKITDICMSHQPRVSELEAVVKEACDYLDTNELTTIGSTSILHRKFKNAIKPPREKKDD